MKIEIKLNPEQALVLDKLFQNTLAIPETSKEKKIFKSVCFDIQDKTDRLATKVKRSPEVFNNKKKFKMTLKFHEAIVTYSFINENLPNTNHNLYLQQVHDILHQKLV